MNKNEYFIEETTDLGYNILWRGVDPWLAVGQLKNIATNNRLELWSKSHAETDKGFAPLGFRGKNEQVISLSHTFKFIHLNLTSADN
jgi:hypothetical protein